MTSMVAGMKVAGRFALEQPASSGAMGTIYRARDLQTGQKVALKLLHAAASSPQSASRLELEAEVLSRLRHPHIVSYIAHGRTQSGLPFLAMEWLEGEDLAQRLQRSLLSVPECLALLRGVAGALNEAHRSGVTHRDIKPGNLFLPAGRIDLVKLLDFGVAREEDAALALTRSGSILGTLEYMSPEQARGARDVGPAADIFSVGCVLYECLAGRPPLQGISVPELFIKLISYEIPPVTSLRSGVPAALEALLQRMLSKTPSARPPDGAALLREVDALGDERGGESVPQAIAREPFAQLDQQLVSVILMCSPDPRTHTPATLDDTGAPPKSPLLLAELQDALRLWGAFSERLSEDFWLVTLTERGTAADLAMQAARLALHLSRLWPECTTSLATGLGTVREGRVSGPAVQRLLEFMHAQRASEPSVAPARGTVWVDELTASLADPQFAVRRVRAGLFELLGSGDYTLAIRPLAGKLTPCIGRERELMTLSSLLDECIDESMARAVLVVAPSGRGKSRLRHELLRRLARSHPDTGILIGRGDPVHVGVGGSMLAGCLRQLSRVVPQDPPEQVAAKLKTTLTRLLPVPQQPRCLGPLCELGTQRLGLVDPVPPSLAEAGALRDLIEHGFVQLMLALSEVGPILLVLEDLHHADALSLRIVQRVQRELSERPLMVLALARPEVHAIFPRLWAEQRVQELRLEPLLPTACQQLIREVLTPAQAAEAAPFILQHGAGNPLYLEELMLSALSDPCSLQLPTTLITLELGRLLRLPACVLRVLRAASVFGMSFLEERVYALLEPFLPAGHIALGLKALAAEDLISRQRQSLFPHTVEYRFRQELTLVAARLLLREEDRELGLAGVAPR